MDKNINKGNSYSDLFEDFFRTDAAQDSITSRESVQSDDIFGSLLGSDDQTVMMNQIQMQQVQNDNNNYYMQQQAQQQQYLYQQGQVPFTPSIPLNTAAIHKPGFIRNRARKNMRQKSVAAAVKASHMMAAVGQAGSGYPLVQNYQAQVAQIPYYQVAAQIPAYQQPQAQVPQQPPMLLAKSPAIQVPLLSKTSQPTSPSSTSARSPNSTSSDYVKFRLQQKIRSRMVSKGQIPPNPTEEELRLCGMQIPDMQSLHQSQLPTPKSSPQQIPRAFNNNAAAFIAAPLMMLSNQQQGEQDDILKYLDLNNYSQKDPLVMAGNNLSVNIKQKQQQQVYPQQEMMSTTNGVNYDQFFSDFILY